MKEYELYIKFDIKMKTQANQKIYERIEIPNNPTAIKEIELIV